MKDNNYKQTKKLLTYFRLVFLNLLQSQIPDLFVLSWKLFCIVDRTAQTDLGSG